MGNSANNQDQLFALSRTGVDIDEDSIVTDAVKMNKEICYSNYIGLCDTIAEESVASEHRKIVQVNNVFEVRPRYDKR